MPIGWTDPDFSGYHFKVLEIGSNRIEGAEIALRVNDDILVMMEDGSDGQLLASVDLYDPTGRHIARLRRNALAFNDGDRVAITTSPTNLTLTDRTTGELLFEAQVLGNDHVRITKATLHDSEGYRISVEGDRVTFGTNFIGGNRIIMPNGGTGLLATTHGQPRGWIGKPRWR